MINRLSEFIVELRETGVPVSMVEAMDAVEALEHTDLSDPQHLRATLGATLVKNSRHYPVFDRTFDVFFGRERVLETAEDESDDPTGGDGGGSGVDGSGGMTDEMVEALLDGDSDTLQRLIQRAIDRYAGMQAGRPVGGRYYAYRVMSRLNADDLLARLLAAISSVES
jgi:uncharacterized protein with von Willebrand factor type A (vWA) domain